MMAPHGDDLLSLLAARRGHFRFESGHHGTLWLELALLCLDPRRIRPPAVQLARRLAPLGCDAVCGPLIEGAFVAQMVAEELDLPFTYAQPEARPGHDGLYPVDYRIPTAQRSRLRGKRVAIVNDVINAGSAVRGAFADLQACGAGVAAIGTLAVLGGWAFDFAAARKVRLETLAAWPNEIWEPAACPLCAAGRPLDPVPDQ